MNDLDYNDNLKMAKIVRYKHITDNYYHFVYNGYRVESVYTNDYYVTCIVRCKSSRRLANKNLNVGEIVCIGDKDSTIIYNEEQYNKIITDIRNYKRKRLKELK